MYIRWNAKEHVHPQAPLSIVQSQPRWRAEIQTCLTIRTCLESCRMHVPAWPPNCQGGNGACTAQREQMIASKRVSGESHIWLRTEPIQNRPPSSMHWLGQMLAWLTCFPKSHRLSGRVPLKQGTHNMVVFSCFPLSIPSSIRGLAVQSCCPA